MILLIALTTAAAALAWLWWAPNRPGQLRPHRPRRTDPGATAIHNLTQPAWAATTDPCHCGRPIPTSRTAYCSDPCQWDDDNHGSDQ